MYTTNGMKLDFAPFAVTPFLTAKYARNAKKKVQSLAFYSLIEHFRNNFAVFEPNDPFGTFTDITFVGH